MMGKTAGGSAIRAIRASDGSPVAAFNSASTFLGTFAFDGANIWRTDNGPAIFKH